jgi:hypothetical protein
MEGLKTSNGEFWSLEGGQRWIRNMTPNPLHLGFLVLAGKGILLLT